MNPRGLVVDWATETLRVASRPGAGTEVAPCIVPALEQLHQAKSALALSGFAAGEAVFVGDNLKTDVLGPQSAGIRSVLLAPVTVHTYRGPQVGSLAAAADLLMDGGFVTP